MTTNKKKSKDLPSYIISYIMDDEEDSDICEKTDNANASVKPCFTFVNQSEDDGGVVKEQIKDIKTSVTTKNKCNDNIVIGKVGTYFVDQSGTYYRQNSKNCLVQIDEVPPADTKCRKFTLPALPKEKLTSATETTTTKKANTRFHKKSIKEDKEIDEQPTEYVFMLQDIGINEVEEVEENDIDDPLTAKTEADANEESKHSKTQPKLIQVYVNKKSNNSAHSEAKETIYACNYCDFSTYKASALSKHVRRHVVNGLFNCSICERSFKSKASLINHVNVHMGLKPHDCKYCSMSFTTAGEVVRHTRYKHTGEKPHKCPDCDYSSVELSKLRRHIRSHTGERPYQCPHCTYASPDTFKLKRHLRTHTGEKPYECDICLARFTQSNSLKSHRLIHSVGDKPVFQCEYCPTTCGRKTDLRAHVFYLHTSDKPIPCKRCTQQLPDRWSYKIHLKTHIGEKSFRCEICPYASTSQRHLDSHMMVHKGVKPFVCTMCDLQFRQTALLKRHMNLYHTTDYKAPQPKEKLHSCPHCNKRFTHNGNLMRHLEMHDPNSNTMKKKKALQLGRKTRINTDGNIVIEGLEKRFEKTASNVDDEEEEEEDEEEEEESDEIMLIEDKDSNENLKDEKEDTLTWNTDEDAVLKFEIDSNDLTLRPITSKTAKSKSKSKSEFKTFVIDDSPKNEHETENSNIMVLRVINYPDDVTYELENDEIITGDNAKSDSCLSYKVYDD